MSLRSAATHAPLTFEVPASWLPAVVMMAHRPSLAPGEWPEDVYAGRVWTFTGERLSTSSPQFFAYTQQLFEEEEG